MLLREDFPMEPLAPGARQDQTLLEAVGLNDTDNAVVLDAAVNNQIPELLRAEAPDTACLWQGGAQEKWADQAPWMATLSPDGHILSNLLTQGPAGWHWWGRWPGIVIRPRRGVVNLRKHLRYLGNVTDQKQRRYFLRFWEPAMAEAFWASHSDSADHIAWRFGEDIAAIYWPTEAGIAKITPGEALPRRPAPKHAIDSYRPLFHAISWQRFQMRVARALDGEGYPFARTGFARTAQMCDAARAAGYRSEAAIWNVVRATVLLEHAGRDVRTEAFGAWGETAPSDENSAARRFLVHARAIADT